MFRILTMLGLGLVSTERARAQDAPAKAEAPPDLAPARGTSEALSVRYRFTEKYSVTDDPEKPELLTQYQVALRGISKTVAEKPRGEPDRSETTSQMIYTERAAKVSKVGEMTDAVRRYDRFIIKAMTPIPVPKPPWFEGLTIWYHRRPGLEPEIESLTDGRQLRELEFDQISKQVFLPQLTAVFPPTPARVGDTWHIPLNAARNLLCDTPDPDDYTLDGTLIEVRKGATELTAVMRISGQFTMSDRECAVGALIYFNFEPRAVLPPGGQEAILKSADGRVKPVEKIVDARGWISELKMTQMSSSAIPESDNRLKMTTTFEFHLARRRQPIAPNPAALLTVPDIAPTAKEDNSWLLYDDPRGQFHFRHPQELRLEPRLGDPNVVGLVDQQIRGAYSLVIHILPKEADPARDRQNRDPEFRRRELYAQWEKQQREIVKGPTGWLPEADWKPSKRRVYRIEAATQQAGGGANAPRLYCDYYLVLFDTDDKAMVVMALTVEDHLKFREQTEAVIKSFDFGPSEGQPQGPAAAQKPAAAPPL